MWMILVIWLLLMLHICMKMRSWDNINHLQLISVAEHWSIRLLLKILKSLRFFIIWVSMKAMFMIRRVISWEMELFKFHSLKKRFRWMIILLLEIRIRIAYLLKLLIFQQEWLPVLIRIKYKIINKFNCWIQWNIIAHLEALMSC